MKLYSYKHIVIFAYLPILFPLALFFIDENILNVTLAVYLFSMITLFIGNLIIKGMPVGELQDHTRSAFYTGLILRLCLAIFFQYMLNVFVIHERRGPGYFFENEFRYNLWAKSVAAYFNNEIDTLYFFRRNSFHILYQYVTGFIYYVFGENLVLLRLFGAAFGSLIIPLSARLGQFIIRKKDWLKFIPLIAWIAAISPYTILFDISAQRDWLITLMILSSVAAAVEMFSEKKKTAKLLAWFFVSIAMLIYLRTASAVIVLFCMGLYWVYTIFRLKKNAPTIMVILLIVFGATFIVMGKSGFIDQISSYISGRYLQDDDYLDAYSSKKLSGEGTSHEGVTDVFKGSIANNIWYGVLNLMKPSPLWILALVRSNTIIWFLPGVEWYIILPLFIVGAYFGIRQGGAQMAPLIVTIVFIILVFFNPLGILANSLRGRLQTLPFIHLFAVKGYLILKEKHLLRNLKALVAFSIAGVSLTYFCLRIMSLMETIKMLSIVGILFLLLVFFRQRKLLG